MNGHLYASHVSITLESTKPKTKTEKRDTLSKQEHNTRTKHKKTTKSTRPLIKHKY